jgi:hypothetical protein
MSDPTRPFLALYIVWHPDFAEGAQIAEALREHFRRKLYENVAGGTGLSVLFRSTAFPGGPVPLPIELIDAETTAIVVLADQILATDADWTNYVRKLVELTEAAGLGTRVFPVAIESSVLRNLGLAEQALRWDRWTNPFEDQMRQLIGELTYEFCRMLRHYLEHLKRPAEEEAALEGYLKKVQIFLSHSKHDADGERIINHFVAGGEGLPRSSVQPLMKHLFVGGLLEPLDAAAFAKSERPHNFCCCGHCLKRWHVSPP